MIDYSGFGGVAGLPDPETLRRYALSSQMPSTGAPASSTQAGASYTTPGTAMASSGPIAPSPNPVPPSASPGTIGSNLARGGIAAGSALGVSGPKPAAPAPTWRNTEDSWINFLGTQGLQGTRPGFFGQGTNTVQDMVARFNKMTNQNARYIGGPSGDMVDFGDGRGPVDVRTAQGEFWYSEPGQGTAAGPAGQRRPGLPPPPGTGGIDPRTGTAGGGNAIDAKMRAELLRQMGLAGAPIDENALGIRQPFEAARNAATRAQAEQRAAMAERLYARGGGNVEESTLDNAIRQSAERNALGLASLKSGLIGNEIAARRTQTAQALQLANALGAREEAMKLQRELANLDNQFRYAQLGQQESQFGRSLGQNQSQFEDEFGLRREFGLSDRNRQAFLDLMGG